jgi:hypothetical protein
MRTGQAVQLVFAHIGPNGWQFENLMAQGPLVLSDEALATPAAAGGLKGNGVIGRQQRPLVALVAGLGTTLAVRGQAWGLAFDRGWVGGGRP